MTRNELFENIRKQQSFLCVGLDTDPRKLPECLSSDPDALFTFNRNIIDATAPYCVAYKPNLAFYESSGLKGWQALEATVAYLRQNYPNHFLLRFLLILHLLMDLLYMCNLLLYTHLLLFL